jgi:hypothetical protein
MDAEEGQVMDDVTPKQARLEAQIVKAYWDLATKNQDVIRLVRIMMHRELARMFADMASADDVKAALLRMYKRGDITLIPESNRKMITPADEVLSVRIGGEDNHLIAIWKD